MNHMDYTLAKQLKNAGFPQGIEDVIAKKVSRKVQPRFPSLEEIIIETSEFRGLEVGDLKPIRWYAKSSSGLIIEGKTLIDAAAKLYLALHK